jgi:hydrogenase expression/formation protein HypC
MGSMCLGIPVKLIERSEREGIGEISGVQRKISLMLVPEAKVGDYVLVHAGCGMQVIDEQAAMETLEILRMIDDEIH